MNTPKLATFAGGCFWCTEAVFRRLDGVLDVVPGYAGGLTENPTYEDVSGGLTGHAEAIQISFDPDVISYETLLTVFWHTHDPTTKNRQGNDVGPQYRSVIFYHDQTQQQRAILSKKQLEDAHVYANPIVTEIVAYTRFYPAEDYHRQYYEHNRDAAYCTLVIDPKIRKLISEFGSHISTRYTGQTPQSV